MKNFVNRSIKLDEQESATIRRAVKRAVRSIFERERSPIKRRILLDSIPSQTYADVALEVLMHEFRLADEEKKKKSKKKRKKVRKSSSIY